jgi:hypothetical protein
LREKQLDAIISGRSGAARVRNLLRTITGVAIPRHAVAAVGNQKDPLRRFRAGKGGARTPFWKEGILVISGRFSADAEIAAAAGGIKLSGNEVMTLGRNHIGLTPALLSKYADVHGLSAP